MNEGVLTWYKFLSTPSGWRATPDTGVGALDLLLFLSTPSGWRATPAFPPIVLIGEISIHALRVEGDPVSFPGTASP